MARTSDPNSGNSQFFLMRAQAEHLDTQYSIWGNTVMGYEHLEKPQVGTIGEVPGWIPDRMNKVEIAADMEDDERPTVQVLRTCLLYTSPSPRDATLSRMPSSA